MQLSLDDIEGWIRAGESETLEFKRTSGEMRQAAETVCGMLNHRGGRVLIGVDKNGRALGQNISDDTIEKLSQELSRIEPPVFPTIETVPVRDGLGVIVVSLHPGTSPPYTHRAKAYRRVGNTTRELAQEEYKRILLERVHANERWENMPATDWSVEDLDSSEIVGTLEESIRRGRTDDPGTRDPLSILRGFGLVKGDHVLWAAVALFGGQEKIESGFQQGTLRVARFRGVDKTEFFDNRQFHGNVFDLLKRAERYLRENLPISGRIQASLFERVDDPLYPPVALREALANAFCHRDYSIGGGSVAIAIFDDRLEITSSGSLHFGLKAADLFVQHESLPWNPLMARVLFRRGIIESWGRGTLKIAELTQKAGLPIPQIEDAGGCVTVRFRPTGYVPPQRVNQTLTERQRQVLLMLSNASDGGLALRDFRSSLGREAQDWEIKNDLSRLKDLDLVFTKGHAMGAKWFLRKTIELE